MATGAVLSARWPVILVAIAVALAGLAAYRRSAGGRIATDRLLARLPVLGAVRRNLAAARLGRTLESLLNAGLPLTQALDVAAGTLVDAGASEDVSRAREEVVTGGALAAALGRARAFPYLFLQMVALGEESGRLEEMLERGATISEEQVERSLGRLVRLLEPALIVTFGIVAGFVAISLLQAIYGMRIEGFSP